jgi:hypothetical protein
MSAKHTDKVKPKSALPTEVTVEAFLDALTRAAFTSMEQVGEADVDNYTPAMQVQAEAKLKAELGAALQGRNAYGYLTNRIEHYMDLAYPTDSTGSSDDEVAQLVYRGLEVVRNGLERVLKVDKGPPSGKRGR